MKNYFKYMLLILLCITLAGCTKTPLGMDAFKDIMQNQKCKTYDLSDSYLDNDDINFMAEAECNKVNVEFYVLETNEIANDIFASTKNDMEKELSGTYKELSEEGDNFNVYKLVNQGKYKYIASVDNTIIYITTSDDNEKAANKIVKELGY